MTYAEIEQKLSDLHLRRGHLARHGKDTTKVSLEIMRLHEMQATLQDVEKAEAQEGREAQANAHQADITKVRTEIADLTAASAKALSESRAAYQKGAQAMRTHLQTESSLRKAQAKLRQLTGENSHIDSEFDLINRRSRQVALVGLKPITNHPSRFGVIEYPGMTLIEWKD